MPHNRDLILSLKGIFANICQASLIDCNNVLPTTIIGCLSPRAANLRISIFTIIDKDVHVNDYDAAHCCLRFKRFQVQLNSLLGQEQVRSIFRKKSYFPLILPWAVFFERLCLERIEHPLC